MVLSAAGNVDHAELVRHAEAQFGRLNGGDGEPIRAGALRRWHAHLGQAVRAEPSRHGVRGAVLSGSRSSTPPRCSRGCSAGACRRGCSRRCGSAAASAMRSIRAAGRWPIRACSRIHAATGPEMMEKLIDVVGAELTRAAAEKPAEAELARSKAQLKAGLLMGLESSSARAEQMARQLLLFDRLIEHGGARRAHRRRDGGGGAGAGGQADQRIAALGCRRRRRAQGRRPTRADGRAHGAGAMKVCDEARVRARASGRKGDSMAFLRSSSGIDAEAEVRGREVFLRQPGDGRLCGLGRAAGAEPPAPDAWEPQWARDELTRSAFRRRLRQYQREMRDDQGYAFLIFREADAKLLGGLSISNVRRGVAQAASVGYWIGAAARPPRPHDGRRAGERCRFAFGTLGLHRLEAACLPHNVASARVLEKAGFTARGHGAPLPEDQRRLAGPRSVRPAARRSARVRTAASTDAAARRSRDAGRGAAARRAACACLALCSPCCLLPLVHAPAAAALKAIEVNNDADRHRDHRARRDSTSGAATPADRDGARRRRRHAAHVRAGGDARHQSRLVRVRADATPPTSRSSAGSTADRYSTVGLGRGVARPRRAARRAVTPSVGFVPERIKNDRADVFRITLEPGQTVTFVAELAVRALRAPLSCGSPSSTSRRAATASSSTASCWASPACSPSS